MNKPQDVSVGITGDGEHIEVWCAKFSLRGRLHGTPGKDREESRKQLEKKIADVLRGIDFGEV